YTLIHTLCRYLSLTIATASEIYTLSLHDALPIWRIASSRPGLQTKPDLLPPTSIACPARRSRTWWSSSSARADRSPSTTRAELEDRKSTRLNSSHLVISYAVSCLKKKNKDICCNL